MNARSTVDPTLIAIAAQVPEPAWTTDELLAAGRGHLSDSLAGLLGQLGVHTRYSIMANYDDVLFAGAEPKLAISASDLAVCAVRECLAKAEVPIDSIGLMLGVTSSPARLVPSLVGDLFAKIPELPRALPNLSIAMMGCSAIAKVMETMRWFLACHPDQRVLVSFMEAFTPNSPPLPGFYSHFSEVGAEQRQETVNAIHGFNFGDVSVAMLFGAEGAGPSFGPVSNLTNDLPEDAELGTVPDGGADFPVVDGRRLYTLSPRFGSRGAHYARESVRRLLADGKTGLASPADAAVLLMYTGGPQILNGLCEEFGVDPGGETIASSYRVLRDHGNTGACNVPLMLAEPVRRPAGEGLCVSLGLGFSSGAFSMTVPEDGWTP
jgi:3-oxoacyl-[acyl-carrier-protein] synthase-3